VLPGYGWRSLFFFAIAPGVLALLMLRNAPDPPSWFEAQKNVAKNPDVRSLRGDSWSPVVVARLSSGR
jgi:hypothetical protein